MLWDGTSDLEPGLLGDLWTKSRKIPGEDESSKARKELGQPVRGSLSGRKADLCKWWCRYPNGIGVPGSETKRQRLDLVLMVSPPVVSSLKLQELIQCVEVSWPRGHTISLFHKAFSISAFSFTFSFTLPFPMLFVASSPRLSLWDLYHISLCSCLRLCPISSSSLAGPHSSPIAAFKSQYFHTGLPLPSLSLPVPPWHPSSHPTARPDFPALGSGRFPWVLTRMSTRTDSQISDICCPRYDWSVLEDNPKSFLSPAGALPV